MYDPGLREEVQQSIELLKEKYVELEDQREFFPTSDYDLVLDIVQTRNKTIRQYYFVDHNTKTLFWLDVYDMNHLLSDTVGAEEPGHISE
jgi:hypothetical protein